MRYPLATDLKSRTGAQDKDARQTNAYIEVKGDQSVVRKRPCAQGGVVTGSGVAQGGIGLNIAGVDYIYTVNGDTGALDTLATAGTNWSSGTAYSVGDHVSVNFVDYWMVDPILDKGSASTDDTGQWSRSPPGILCSGYAIPSPVVVGTSSEGPFGILPTVPSPTLLSHSIVQKLPCGGILHHLSARTYALRSISGNTLQINNGTNTQIYSDGGCGTNTNVLSTYIRPWTIKNSQGNIISSGTGIEVDNFNYCGIHPYTKNFTTYAMDASSAATYVALGVTPAPPGTQWFFLTASGGGDNNTPQHIAGSFVDMGGPTSYYLDATVWNYYTVT